MSALLRCASIVLLVLGQYTVLKDINPGHRNAVEIAGFCVVLTGLVLGPVCQMWRDLTNQTKEQGGTGDAKEMEPVIDRSQSE